jgi:hypothetical protein
MKTISRAEFARRCGVSKPAITNACKKELAPACVGDRIDVDHESARAYMARKGVRLGEMVSAVPVAAAPAAAPTKGRKNAASVAGAPTTGRQRKQPRAATTPAPGPSPDVGSPLPGSSDDLEDLANALRPFLERFGTDESFKLWLGALKEIELIREKRLKNEETEGRLISRELVKVHVFGAIEAANKRLLADAPKTVASRLFEIARSSTGSLEQGERLVRDELASHLRPLKATAARNLRPRSSGPGDSDGQA